VKDALRLYIDNILVRYVIQWQALDIWYSQVPLFLRRPLTITLVMNTILHTYIAKISKTAIPFNLLDQYHLQT
jgi:hypothetical protein